jgi:cobalt-zinc-cadmium efflux system outer membrane protein
MDYQNSIFELDAIINDHSFSFNSVNGRLTEINSLPNYDSLLVKFTNNPNLKKFESEYNKHKAEIIFEKSKSIPNLTVSGGYKRLNEVNANTFLVGASLPLPIFNRNQGSIQRAKILLEQKSNEFNKIKNMLTLQLNLNYNKLKMLLSSAKKLKIESLPIAKEAFEIISKGNQVGRFKILDVLDAQRTLFEVQNQYLNTVCEINKVIVELEGLTNFDFN